MHSIQIAVTGKLEEHRARTYEAQISSKILFHVKAG